MKTKAIKARRMITNASGASLKQNYMEAWHPKAVSASGNPTEQWPNPVFVIPADPASYQSLVEQGARAIAYESDTSGCVADKLTVEDVLKAVGILPPRRSKEGKR